MRTTATWLGAFVLLACGAGRAEGQVRCASPEGALPAGMYWTRVGWYEHTLDCPPPRVALVEGVYASEVSAQRAVRRLPSMHLEPGFPRVVEARYAGLDADGVAVVLGWFETETEARRFSESRRRGGAATLVRVLPRREALGRLPNRAVEAGEPQPRNVVWVPNAVTAYTFTYEPVPGTRGEREVPSTACRVPARSVFVTDPGVWHRSSPHGWLPVRCGHRLAWVEVTATSHERVTWVERDGRTRVSQVTEVECDTPTHTTWEVDESGQRVNIAQSGGSCGEP